jgi:hypothetical protein
LITVLVVALLTAVPTAVHVVPVHRWTSNSFSLCMFDALHERGGLSGERRRSRESGDRIDVVRVVVVRHVEDRRRRVPPGHPE